MASYQRYLLVLVVCHIIFAKFSITRIAHISYVSHQTRISQDSDTNWCGMQKHQEAEHVYFQKTKNKTHLLLKITSNSQGLLNPQGERVWNSLENRKKKSLNFIDWIIVKKMFIDLGAYLRVLWNLTD